MRAAIRRGRRKSAASLEEKVGTIREVVPGSAEAMQLKDLLIEQGMWSQYLEVAIGPDAEIFSKAPVLSTVGAGAMVGVRSDSSWNNPEPEVVLVCDAHGEVVGATLGNDVNLRDFEGRSALLLSKAKDNNASCAIGPFVRLFDEGFTIDDVRQANVDLHILGPEGYVLEGSNDMRQISRDPLDLVAAMPVRTSLPRWVRAVLRHAVRPGAGSRRAGSGLYPQGGRCGDDFLAAAGQAHQHRHHQPRCAGLDDGHRRFHSQPRFARAYRQDLITVTSTLSHYIGGAFTGAGDALESINPSDTAEIVARFPQGDAGHVDAAVAAAQDAQKGWADASPEVRADLLEKIAQALFARSAEIGELLAREEGKLRGEGVGETLRAARIFRYFAGEALRRHGLTLESTRPGLDVATYREAVGPVGLITPWNFPIAIPAWKAAPALAFGNTVVIAPSNETPAVAHMLAEIIHELRNARRRVQYGAGRRRSGCRAGGA